MKSLFTLFVALLFFVSAEAQIQASFTYSIDPYHHNRVTCTSTSTGNLANAVYQWRAAVGEVSYGQTAVINSLDSSSSGVYLIVLDTVTNQAYGTHQQVVFSNPMFHGFVYEPNPASCSNCPDGALMVNVMGGQFPYSYLWSNGNTTSQNYNITPGTYSVVVTDAVGDTLHFSCIHDTIADNNVCPPQLIKRRQLGFTTYDSSFTFAGYFSIPQDSFYYNFGDNTMFSDTNDYVAHIYPHPGFYQYTISYSQPGCPVQLFTDSILVLQFAPPNLQLINLQAPSCMSCTDGQATAIPTGGVGPYSYMWYPSLETDSAATALPNNNLAVQIYDFVGSAHYNTGFSFPGPTCSASFTLYPDLQNPNLYWVVSGSSGAGPIHYLWDWGDNTSDTIPFPSHTYNLGGLYPICLTISDSAGCSDTYCYNLQVVRLSSSAQQLPATVNVVPNYNPSAIANQTSSSIQLFPNPVTDHLFIQNLPAESSYIISDLLGKQMAAGDFNSTEINTADLLPGSYLLKIQNKSGLNFTKRFVKQ